VDVSATNYSKAFATGGQNKSKKGRSKSSSKARTIRQASDSSSNPVVQDHLSSLLSVFRDQLYKHLETVTENDFDSFATKLVQAGSTLEFLKYAEALFEIILVGGLIQPGGSYIDDAAPTSPFTIFNAKDPASIEDLKKYVEVLNKLIRRYTHISMLDRSAHLIL
jgi:hypothetical protein